MYCKKQNSLTNETCENCNRILDRDKLRTQEKQKEQRIIELESEVLALKLKNIKTEGVSEPVQMQDLFKLFQKLQLEVQQIKQ